MFVLDNVPIGVELEYEHPDNIDCHLEDISAYWKVEEEGSLRDGIELVTRGAGLMGDTLEQALQRLSCLNLSEANLSPRGSVHIHMDIIKRPNPIWFKSFIILAVLAEKVLWTHLPNVRKITPFCRPVHKTGWWNQFCSMSNALWLDAQTPTINFVDQLYSQRVIDSNRYLSINLNSVIKLGTVEFRLFPPTINIDDIRAYINYVLTIYLYADKIIKQGAKSMEDAQKIISDKAFQAKFYQALDVEHKTSGKNNIVRMWSILLSVIPPMDTLIIEPKLRFAWNIQENTFTNLDEVLTGSVDISNIHPTGGAD